MVSHPNIVLIMADDMGYSDLGCYGGEIETPNLDRLASQGARFSQFYNNAVCAPTRSSLLTGLYPAQVGLGEENRPTLRPDNNVTIAEMLRKAGYRTLMVGKWHNGPEPEQLPVNRGFDRYWGLLSGCCNYFNPGLPRPGEPAPAHKAVEDYRHWGDEDRVIRPFTPEKRDFYTTDEFTTKAVEYLDQYGIEDQPFFLYLAYCAPHFPMQAWPEDIEKYQGRYMIGWEEVRRQRYERLLKEGLIEPRWGLSQTDERSPSWQDVENKEYWDLLMSVYAAMVDRMDQGIGLVMEKLRELGKEENTLVLFLSDNGGCPASLHNTPDVPPGPVNSYHTIDIPWANASNTPFRLFKAFDHEGGISTPLIARWPRIIPPGGGIIRDMGHVVDFMPTFLELAGGEYPESYEGREVLPAEGQSLASVLRGEGQNLTRKLFWAFSGCRAIRQGRWKLVSQGPERGRAGFRVPAGHESWELYDVDTDRCELNDLSRTYPERAAELESLWKKWHGRVMPLSRPK